jgi:chorismate mutase
MPGSCSTNPSQAASDDQVAAKFGLTYLYWPSGCIAIERSPYRGDPENRRKQARIRMEQSMTLEELRKQIDELDRQLVDLLSNRAEAALEAGRLKAATSLPIYEPAREKTIYENVREANHGPLPDLELIHIFERIIDVMRTLQMNELASQRLAQGNAQAASVGHEAGVQSPETGNRQ